MPGPGRNQPCPCGSHRKTKHCCGQHRGPAAEQLARAHVAALCQQAIPDLAQLSDNALDILWEGLIDLPGVDYSLLVTLPTLIAPDLQRLREAVQHDNPDWGGDALTTVATQIDTPQQRARLADAIVALRDRRRIGRRQAAYALLDLNTPSTRLIAARSRRHIRRRPPHPQRPPNRRLTPAVYPGEVTRQSAARVDREPARDRR